MPRRRRLLVLALTAIGALAAAGIASAATSSNWAGYATAAPGQSFTDVKGSWVVPQVSCPPVGSSYSSFWVGLGGFAGGATGLEQVGTSSDCQGGSPVYSSWYELIPAPSVDTGLAVNPGDTVNAEVSANGTAVTLTLVDTTTGQTFSTTQTVATPDLSSAEWIAEAPSQCVGDASTRCATLPLASFGTVTFTGAGTTAGTTAGTISNPAWTATPIQLAPRAYGSATATPGPLSADGSSFAVTTTAAPAPTVSVTPPTTRVRGWGGWHRLRWRWR